MAVDLSFSLAIAVLLAVGRYLRSILDVLRRQPSYRLRAITNDRKHRGAVLWQGFLRYHRLLNSSTRGKFGIRVKGGDSVIGWVARARFVNSPTIPGLARPAILL